MLTFETRDDGIALVLPTTDEGSAAYTVADLADVLTTLTGIDPYVLARVLFARTFDGPQIAMDQVLDLAARAQQSRRIWQEIVATEAVTGPDSPDWPAGLPDRNAREDDDDRIIADLAGLFPAQPEPTSVSRYERARVAYHAAREAFDAAILAEIPRVVSTVFDGIDFTGGRGGEATIVGLYLRGCDDAGDGTDLGLRIEAYLVDRGPHGGGRLVRADDDDLYQMAQRADYPPDVLDALNQVTSAEDRVAITEARRDDIDEWRDDTAALDLDFEMADLTTELEHEAQLDWLIEHDKDTYLDRDVLVSWDHPDFHTTQTPEITPLSVSDHPHTFGGLTSARFTGAGIRRCTYPECDFVSALDDDPED